tara:strand:- start:618 stop:962 length:345 start_codon:yes stop_codon:yes gene_type:complete
MTTSKDFMLDKEHVGQKVFEITEKREVIIKTHVIAEDRDKAFNKWLECNEHTTCENIQCKDNGSDIINHWAKDYGGYDGVEQIGEVKEERVFPNDDEDDTMEYTIDYDHVISSV